MNTSSERREWVLQVTEGPSMVREFQLDAKQVYELGRREHGGEWKPDIDLFPDTAVSRRHARLSFEDGSWRIEDVGSSGGTRVDGIVVAAGEQCRLVAESASVQMGDTAWTVSPSDICRASWNRLGMEFRAVPVITYGLYHCNVPVISHIRFENLADCDHESFTVTFVIPGYSDPYLLKCDGIPQGGIQETVIVPLRLHYEKLEGCAGKKRAEIHVRINDDVVLRKNIEILGFYEWPIHTAYRKSLACFVQPAHPVVTDIVAEATIHLERQGFASSFANLLRSDHTEKASIALMVIYETLRDHYDLKYNAAAPGSDARSQTIRPPHGIITHQKKRKGAGTCIDLAILLASVLEHVSLQPVIILQKRLDRQFYHALVGCWRHITPRLEPISRDHDRLSNAVQNEKLHLVEVTGLTDRFLCERGEKLSYPQASEMAVAQSMSEQLLFVLDVAAARQTVAPLHMPLNPEALRVVLEAERMAHDEGAARLETRHLFLGLVTDGQDAVLSVLKKAGGDPANLSRIDSSERLEPKGVPRPTVNYRRCLEDAKIAASDGGVIFVNQEHLLYAILQSQSDRVDDLLEEMGTDRSAAKHAFGCHFLWTASLVETHFE